MLHKLATIFSLLLPLALISQNSVSDTGKFVLSDRLGVDERTFDETQDSLRKILLQSKPSKKLKSSLLQELYIRGLVDEQDDHISFNLPFDLHALGCGAPDCYSTDISFTIPSGEKVVFPEEINFDIHEDGCVDQETTVSSLFTLAELSADHVNYYSEHLKSTLIITRGGKLYYYPHLKAKSIGFEHIEKMFADQVFEGAEVVPYQSTLMVTHAYDHFFIK